MKSIKAFLVISLNSIVCAQQSIFPISFSGMSATAHFIKNEISNVSLSSLKSLCNDHSTTVLHSCAVGTIAGLAVMYYKKSNQLKQEKSKQKSVNKQ